MKLVMKLFGGRREDADRRSAKRYPIETDVTYRVMRGKKHLRSGTGRTVNISSKGLLLQAENPLPKGTDVELALEWPAMLNNECGLNLIVSGKVVRSEADISAVRILRYQFKTRGRRSSRAASATAASAGISG
ncbi:MAG: PilZ domain-containing protein [Bryobacteraceae bacterium]|nr:PilZ domain-containing protein [Bryobacteraceae bacterium]